MDVSERVASEAPKRSGDAVTLWRLRGSGHARPQVDRPWCAGLREQMEDGLAAVVAELDSERPLQLHWSALDEGPAAQPDLPGGELGPLRWCQLFDVLVRMLFRQLVVTGTVGEPLADASAALQLSGDRDGLLRELARLKAVERRKLVRELSVHVDRLVAAWPALDPRWAPRTGERLVAPLAGGRVLLSAHVDLAVGRPAVGRASVTFVSATSGGVGSAPWRRLLFASLVEALRSGAAPFQIAVLSTVTGTLHACSVETNDLLCLAESSVAAAASAVAARRADVSDHVKAPPRAGSSADAMNRLRGAGAGDRGGSARGIRVARRAGASSAICAASGAGARSAPSSFIGGGGSWAGEPAESRWSMPSGRADRGPAAQRRPQRSPQQRPARGLGAPQIPAVSEVSGPASAVAS